MFALRNGTPGRMEPLHRKSPNQGRSGILSPELTSIKSDVACLKADYPVELVESKLSST